MAAKCRILAELLRTDYIRDGKPGGRLPTEAELMGRYHMSRQTVRRALQQLCDEGLIQRRQGSGSYIAEPERDLPKKIAILASFQDDYIFPTLLRDTQSVFASHGISVAVYATGNNVAAEREILTGLLREGVGGILVEGSKTALPTPNADLYHKLQLSGTALLFLHGSYSNLTGIPCISDANYAGGYQLARHLIGKGHGTIGGIFKSDDRQGPERYHGTVSALTDAGLPVLDRAFCWYDTHDRSVMVDGKDARLLDRFLTERLTEVTALVCYNDEIANLVIRRLLAMGKRVPEDMAVVSFDNSYYCQVCPVGITSLTHKAERMGRMAAQRLIRMLRGEAVQSVSLGWTLVARDSG